MLHSALKVTSPGFSVALQCSLASRQDLRIAGSLRGMVLISLGGLSSCQMMGPSFVMGQMQGSLSADTGLGYFCRSPGDQSRSGMSDIPCAFLSVLAISRDHASVKGIYEPSGNTQASTGFSGLSMHGKNPSWALSISVQLENSLAQAWLLRALGCQQTWVLLAYGEYSIQVTAGRLYIGRERSPHLKLRGRS